MKYVLTQNQTSSYFETLEEAIAAVQYEEAEIWERNGTTDTFHLVWSR